MIVTSNKSALRKYIRGARLAKKRIGFIPTMGALHQGHLSLVEAAKKATDLVVVSIFINPLQFGPKEDFTKYPRPRDSDLKLLKEMKTDIVFIPDADLIPKDLSTYVEETTQAQGLCARSRPGHFKGVCTIVTKLFNLVQPDIAYLGQKDFQQARIIEKMAKDLDFPVTIKIMPTIREKSGLALSSRNAYLDPCQRKKAAILYAALKAGRKAIQKGQRNPGKLIALMKKILATQQELCIEYLEILDAQSLTPLRNTTTHALIAIAAHIDKVRLIDNIICKVH